MYNLVKQTKRLSSKPAKTFSNSFNCSRPKERSFIVQFTTERWQIIKPLKGEEI